MPKFIWWTSSVTTRSHVELGLPWGRFQDDGGFYIAACTARRWTSVGSARATWLKKLSLLAHTMSETGSHCVTGLTSAFVTSVNTKMSFQQWNSNSVSTAYQWWKYTFHDDLHFCAKIANWLAINSIWLAKYNICDAILYLQARCYNTIVCSVLTIPDMQPGYSTTIQSDCGTARW